MGAVRLLKRLRFLQTRVRLFTISARPAAARGASAEIGTAARGDPTSRQNIATLTVIDSRQETPRLRVKWIQGDAPQEAPESAEGPPGREIPQHQDHRMRLQGAIGSPRVDGEGT